MAKKKQSPKAKATAEPEPEAEAVDYGATADAYAADKSDLNTDDEEEEEEETSLEMAVHEDDDDDEDEEVAGTSSASDNEEEEGEEEEEEAVVAINPPKRTTPTESGGEESCSFDLRNLTAIQEHPLDERELFVSSASKIDEKLTIANNSRSTNEEYLLNKATQGCTQLLQVLWELPTERSDAGPLATLPTYDASVPIPRALPPPPPKQETKWEKFAKERGISLNKEKRSRKVWDEATNSWKFRTGFDKANAVDKEWPILEVGPNDDPYADPWQAQREEKTKRLDQNRHNQLKNQERAGMLPKGTTRRVMKNLGQTRAAGKAGGQQDVLPTPVGVPVDVTKGKLRGSKASIMGALKHTQVSTASLGKFDKLRDGEPERKAVLQASKKKRKFITNDSGGGGGGEQERASKVLQTVLQGGGVEKEKARQKGKLAKGVSAYDYEYNDGTSDNALFKKKKGRAAAGKNRKMTKKRIK